MTTLTSVDKVLEAFPIQSIVKIHGEPNYESINNLARALKTNAASISTHLGGGNLGHLALCVTPEVYATLSPTPFAPPQNPGPIYNPPAGTGAVIAAAERLFNERSRQFHLYNNTDKALKRQLLEAVEPTYLRAKENRITGFANVTTLDLLTHLFFTYGRITPSDLEENDKKFKKQWDTNQPFEALIDQVEDAVDFAAAGQAPYSPAQIVANAYNLVFNTGMYPEACRDWRRRAPNTMTWDNFKAEFGIAHTDLRNQRHTSQQAGFQQANNIMEFFCREVGEPFSHLALAAAADKDIVKTLTATNNDLIKQLAVKDKEIVRLRGLLTKQGKTPGKSGKDNSTADSTNKRFDNENYCWTHGYDCHHTHTSETCKWPAPGHIRDATKDDNKGGSQLNKGKRYI